MSNHTNLLSRPSKAVSRAGKICVPRIVRTTNSRSLVQIILLTIFLAVVQLGAATSISAQQKPPTAQVESQAEIDLIHYGDLIDVDVVGSFEYDWRGTLTPEGFLNGLERSEEQIYALCRPEKDVAADIAREYGKTLREPQVKVAIVDRSNRAAAILTGAVKTPQRFQLRRAARLNELLALSGGITETASGTIVIFRPADLNCAGRLTSIVQSNQKNDPNTNPPTVSIRIRDLLAGDPVANPEILSGDIITVAEDPPIYVLGAVNNPRQIASKPDITLTSAIAGAGGAAKEARHGRVTIYRRENNKSTVIDVDLRKIESGENEDIKLKPFDIIDVDQSAAPRRRFAPRAPYTRTYDASLFRLPLRIVD